MRHWNPTRTALRRPSRQSLFTVRVETFSIRAASRIDMSSGSDERFFIVPSCMACSSLAFVSPGGENGHPSCKGPARVITRKSAIASCKVLAHRTYTIKQVKHDKLSGVWCNARQIQLILTCRQQCTAQIVLTNHETLRDSMPGG